jgi:site-specific recombinase XerD
MGDNQDLSHLLLVRKCVALVMATTGARFTEIAQFSREDSDPEDSNSKWSFVVRVKNRRYAQPVVLHHTQTESIDPIRAMIEMRERVRRMHLQPTKQDDFFWYDERGKAMSIDEIRGAALDLMHAAGIHDARAYHIKHATVSWLHKQGVPADQIIRFIRHALGSTTYMQYYLSEDLGERCTGIIDSTTMLDDQDSAISENQRERNAGDVWENSPQAAIANTINAAVTAPPPIVRASKKRFLRSSRK